MRAMQISPEAARILGCLLEKERTTPDQYPLSLNALLNACNQTTNRWPVVRYDEATVDAGLDELRGLELIRREKPSLAASLMAASTIGCFALRRRRRRYCPPLRIHTRRRAAPVARATGSA